MAKSQAERRKHKRHKIPCPVSFLRGAEEKTVKGKTLDVSDGGAMVAVPIRIVPRLSERVKIVLGVPRETPNTHMLEEFSCEARVVRHQPLEDNEVVGIAIQFQAVQDLGLEV